MTTSHLQGNGWMMDTRVVALICGLCCLWLLTQQYRLSADESPSIRSGVEFEIACEELVQDGELRFGTASLTAGNRKDSLINDGKGFFYTFEDSGGDRVVVFSEKDPAEFAKFAQRNSDFFVLMVKQLAKNLSLYIELERLKQKRDR